MYLALHGIITNKIQLSLDADAQAFVTASGISDPVQISAIDNLVKDLKAASLWTKFKAIWPFVGGTESRHKWNLKDPRDLDAAFRLVFYGGWTHSSTGALPNAVNGYANTFIVPKDVFVNFNIAVGVYSRTDVIGYQNEMGVRPPTGASDQFNILPRHSGSFFGDLTFERRVSSTNSSSTGFQIISRISSTDVRIYRNTTQLAQNTSSLTRPLSNQTLPLALSAMNNNGTNEGYSGREKALAFVSVGLTSAEISTLNTINTTFQTALSRNV